MSGTLAARDLLFTDLGYCERAIVKFPNGFSAVVDRAPPRYELAVLDKDDRLCYPPTITDCTERDLTENNATDLMARVAALPEDPAPGRGGR